MKIYKGILSLVLLSVMEILIGQNYFEISVPDFNTRSKELAPAFYKNGLVFCSDRRIDFITSYTDYNNNPLTNLFFAEKKKHNNFSMPRLMAKELTTFMFEGPSSFSRDGRIIYFTRSIDITVRNRNHNRGDTTFGIFISRELNGQWTPPFPFDYNSAAYNTGYPFLSDDGNQLFFCSDQPGGIGGLDIYVSEFRGGNWSKPENLGSNVNTSKNEVFPFLHNNGRLYFASRGLNNTGDLDIYYTMKKDGAWQKPVQLEEPFNTDADDFGVIFNQLHDTAYFVSDRNGSADIFSAVSMLPSFTGCADQQENDFCFVFYESNNNEIDTTTFAYEWDMGDGTKIRALEAEHCFAKPGTYVVQLNIIDKLTEDVLLSEATYNFTVEKLEQPYITVPEIITAGREIRLSGSETYLKNFIADQYYWDFGDGARSKGLETEYTYRIPGTYNIVLGVTGKFEGSEKPSEDHCVTRKIIVLEPKN